MIFELFLRDFISPITERPLCELHDVSFMNQRDTLPLMSERILNGHPDETLRSKTTDGFNSDSRIFPDPLPHLSRKERNESRCLLRSFLPFDPCIDILGVLPKDNHVHSFRML